MDFPLKIPQPVDVGRILGSQLPGVTIECARIAKVREHALFGERIVAQVSITE